MSSVGVLLITLALFAAGYRWYGSKLSRVFGVDPSRATPAHTKKDGRDFVPARNAWVLFGHHFSSICGAGPIVGPVLAVAYWGWAPSLVWLVVGSLFLGAVSDFSSLLVSVRAGGESIPEVARPEISPRARFLFSAFIWLSLILVIAVFSILAAKTYLQVAETVLPSWGLMPVAVLTGWFLYRTRFPAWVGTAVGLSLLVLLLWAGGVFPVRLPGVAGLSPERLWVLLLLAYAFIASVMPVNVLLQPRDYLASFLLFASIGVGVFSVLVSRPAMDPVPLHSLWPEAAGAGPIWPMMFVTIACGAISGFHALVSSGTTCKQLGTESHACRIGYGGMLVEGLVGALVVICVAGALNRTEFMEALKAGGPIAAYGKGYGALAFPLLGGFGTAFAVLALNAFILTTLDTAARIGRYLTGELFGIRSPFLSTGLVVGAAGWLALTGHWSRIWPAFGTSNQLVAGLSLLVVSCWLARRGRPTAYTLVPAAIMLVTTVVAFGFQIRDSLARTDYLVAGVAGVLIALAGVVLWESVAVLLGKGCPAKALSQ